MTQVQRCSHSLPCLRRNLGHIGPSHTGLSPSKAGHVARLESLDGVQQQLIAKAVHPAHGVDDQARCVRLRQHIPKEMSGPPQGDSSRMRLLHK